MATCNLEVIVTKKFIEVPLQKFDGPDKLSLPDAEEMRSVICQTNQREDMVSFEDDYDVFGVYKQGHLNVLPFRYALIPEGSDEAIGHFHKLEEIRDQNEGVEGSGRRFRAVTLLHFRENKLIDPTDPANAIYKNFADKLKEHCDKLLVEDPENEYHELVRD